MRKWIVLSACIILQTVLGCVYAWSAFVPSLANEHRLTNGRCGLIFGITIAVFTVVMIAAGRLLVTFGPRIIAVSGALLFSAGYLLASFSSGRFDLIFIGIGVLKGAGIGACYVCPLTVAMKWFPNYKGLVTGITVAGFGGGAIIISNLVHFMLVQLEMNVLQVFRINGIVLGTIAFVAAMLLKEPQVHNLDSSKINISLKAIKQHIMSKTFVMLWIGMFAGTFAGLLVVGNLKPIILSGGFDDRIATLGISIFAVGNALGRIVWGQIHDRLNVRATVLFSLSSLAIALAPLAARISEGYLLMTIGIAGAGFGACFVVYALSIVRIYGTQLFPVLYPICFLGYGLAGIIGPAMGGWLADLTNSFTAGIIIGISIIFFAILFIGRGLSSHVHNADNVFLTCRR